jgi:hypothetical protein
MQAVVLSPLTRYSRQSKHRACTVDTCAWFWNESSQKRKDCQHLSSVAHDYILLAACIVVSQHSDVIHKLKRIGSMAAVPNRVPERETGHVPCWPCNVLLLRNQITLPSGSDVCDTNASAALAAEYILDKHSRLMQTCSSTSTMPFRCSPS